MSHAISAFALLYLSLLPVLSYGSAQEVANQLFPKTVLLNMNDTSGRPLALGSGFVLKKGYIVSNYHLVVGSGVHRSEFFDWWSKVDLFWGRAAALRSLFHGRIRRSSVAPIQSRRDESVAKMLHANKLVGYQPVIALGI
jgi:hypothetical protein